MNREYTTFNENNSSSSKIYNKFGFYVIYMKLKTT